MYIMLFINVLGLVDTYISYVRLIVLEKFCNNKIFLKKGGGVIYAGVLSCEGVFAGPFRLEFTCRIQVF